MKHVVDRFRLIFSEQANQSTNEIFLEVPQKKLIRPEFMIMIMSRVHLTLAEVSTVQQQIPLNWKTTRTPADIAVSSVGEYEHIW